MLQVQRYLTAGKSLDDLRTELGIRVAKHPTDPLVILNYDQIDSPKTHPVVRECRGITLERGTWNVVAKAFDRFFEWGEVANEAHLFDWSDFTCQSKEDGSLVLVYHYQGQWRVNTRGSFGGDPVARGVSVTWHELVWPRIQHAELDPNRTYVFELTSPHNRIVRHYDDVAAHLLAVFEGSVELSPSEVDAFADRWSVKRPARYQFSSVDEIREWLHDQSREDSSFEGVVVRDRNGMRWKVKTRTYESLHFYWACRDPTAFLNRVVPFLLCDNPGALLARHPELTDKYEAFRLKVDEARRTLFEVWAKTKDIEDQKVFAKTVSSATPFNALLFQLRKLPAPEQTEQNLQRLWRKAEGLVAKFLKL
ncbi:MAG: T4 RnlA family RNA ligase [Gemmataceae bacterium]